MHKHSGYEEQDPSTLDSHSHSDSDSDPFDELPDENGMFENFEVMWNWWMSGLKLTIDLEHFGSVLLVFTADSI